MTWTIYIRSWEDLSSAIFMQSGYSIRFSMLHMVWSASSSSSSSLSPKKKERIGCRSKGSISLFFRSTPWHMMMIGWQIVMNARLVMWVNMLIHILLHRNQLVSVQLIQPEQFGIQSLWSSRRTITSSITFSSRGSSSPPPPPPSLFWFSKWHPPVLLFSRQMIETDDRILISYSSLWEEGRRSILLLSLWSSSLERCSNWA